MAVAVFFIGLGALVDNVGAKFKSDEKALDLVRKARLAIGGDAAINAVQSMRIVGQSTRTFKIDGADRSEQGETEIALQLPDKIMKSIKMGHDDGTGLVERRIDKQVDVVIVGDAKDKMKVSVDTAGQGEGPGTVRKIVIRKDDGTVQELTGDDAAKFIAKEHPGSGEVHTIILKKKADGTVEKVTGGENVFINKRDGGTFITKDEKSFNIDGHDVVMERSTGGVHAGGPRDNELLRTTLSLLLTAPQGMDVSYTFGGESDVDGTTCNIVVAEFAGASYKIFLGKSSNLPVMMSYVSAKMPQIFFRTAEPKAGDQPKDNLVFTRKVAAPNGSAETAEVNVRFSDYRAVNGVQLPYRWVQADEIFDVTTYEINPANIGERFNDQSTKVRITKSNNK